MTRVKNGFQRKKYINIVLYGMTDFPMERILKMSTQTTINHITYSLLLSLPTRKLRL